MTTDKIYKVADLLTKSDRETLSELFESHYYTSLKKFLDLERVELAKRALNSTPDGLVRIQGQAEALKAIHGAMHDIHKSMQVKKRK